MKEYLQMFWALLLHISCLVLGFSLFNLTGLNTQFSQPIIIREVVLIVASLSGIALVSKKSLEPFTHSFLKLMAQGFEWFFLLLTLAFVARALSNENTMYWFATGLFAAMTYGIHKLKNSSRLNVT